MKRTSSVAVLFMQRKPGDREPNEKRGRGSLREHLARSLVLCHGRGSNLIPHHFKFYVCNFRAKSRLAEENKKKARSTRSAISIQGKRYNLRESPSV